MAALKKLAESFQQAQGEAPAGADDDEIPDLVESFDNATVEDKKDVEEKKEETA
jgi:nascent polypeptide-associated complex subunit beta